MNHGPSPTRPPNGDDSVGDLYDTVTVSEGSELGDERTGSGSVHGHSTPRPEINDPTHVLPLSIDPCGTPLPPLTLTCTPFGVGGGGVSGGER